MKDVKIESEKTKTEEKKNETKEKDSMLTNKPRKKWGKKK